MSPPHTVIKICGVTRTEDARAAAAAGADYIGLIRAPGPRAAPEDRVADICRALPPAVRPVLLYVDAPGDAIAADVARFGVRHVQLHGEETPERIADLARRLPEIAWIRAWPLRDDNSVAALGRHLDEVADRGVTLHAAVLDAPKGEPPPPQSVFLAAAAECRRRGIPAWRAGGLTPENVGPALAAASRAFGGVDVARGVESAAGIKDAGRIQALIAAVRAAGRGSA
jgi:phosphoribosylanthranilate isomerase